MTCDRCLTPATEGAHGIGLCPFEARTLAASVKQDQIPGGMVIENLCDRPVKVYSWSERKRLMKLHNVEEFIRHVPGDKHVKSWATMDPQTMANAESLVARIGRSRVSHEDDVPQYPVIETHIVDTGEVVRVRA